MMAGVVRPVAGEVVGHHVDPIHGLEQELLAEPFERAGIGMRRPSSRTSAVLSSRRSRRAPCETAA